MRIAERRDSSIEGERNLFRVIWNAKVVDPHFPECPATKGRSDHVLVSIVGMTLMLVGSSIIYWRYSVMGVNVHFEVSRVRRAINLSTRTRYWIARHLSIFLNL